SGWGGGCCSTRSRARAGRGTTAVAGRRRAGRRAVARLVRAGARRAGPVSRRAEGRAAASAGIPSIREQLPEQRVHFVARQPLEVDRAAALDARDTRG